MPLTTTFLLLAMQSIVAGVTEEAAFRGYMQSPIERVYGVAVAILVNGTLFGLLPLQQSPARRSVDAPVLHSRSGGIRRADVGGQFDSAGTGAAFGGGRRRAHAMVGNRPARGQLAAAPPPLVWEHGVDASFVLTATSCVVLALLTARAYQAVGNLRVQALASTPVDGPVAGEPC